MDSTPEEARVYTNIRHDIYDQLELYKEITAVTTKQTLECAVKFCIDEELESFFDYLINPSEEEKIWASNQIQIWIDARYRGVVDKITDSTGKPQKEVVGEMLEYCLDMGTDSPFDDYVLDHTPSPEFNDTEDEYEPEALPGQEVDRFMEMSKEEAQDEIDKEIGSLGSGPKT